MASVASWLPCPLLRCPLIGLAVAVWTRRAGSFDLPMLLIGLHDGNKREPSTTLVRCCTNCSLQGILHCTLIAPAVAVWTRRVGSACWLRRASFIALSSVKPSQCGLGVLALLMFRHDSLAQRCYESLPQGVLRRPLIAPAVAVWTVRAGSSDVNPLSA
jgi:hypothetical protein